MSIPIDGILNQEVTLLIPPAVRNREDGLFNAIRRTPKPWIIYLSMTTALIFALLIYGTNLFLQRVNAAPAVNNSLHLKVI